MSSQTRVNVSSIEHLEHEIVCTAERHQGEPSKADYWIEMHGCNEAFACQRCFSSWVQEWKVIIEVWGECICRHCNRAFAAIENVARVVLL